MPSRLPWLLLWAGGFALAEILLTLSIGQFALRGRAEVGIFLAFRPWLLILLVLAAMRRPLAERWLLYAGAILLASGSEALLVHALGAPAAMIEAVRPVAAGIALALAFDIAAMLCARLPGWRGAAAAGVAGLALILVPGPLALYERIALRGEPALPARRPPLTLLTGLPLIWGEDGIEHALGEGGASATYRVLSAHFRVRPIDAATLQELARVRLLLIAQPRPPGPAGLVAIDRWVRDGGRALILTDPAPRWPSGFGPGDPRRPPLYDGLGPLLSRWGLTLESPLSGNALVTREISGRRILMAAPGRFSTSNGACMTRQAGLLADCRIGRGRALLLADADLLHDLLWAGPGAIGSRRAGRLADNAAFVIERLAELDGWALLTPDRIDWITRPDSFESGLLAAFAVPLSSLLLGLGLLIRGRRASTEKDSYRLIHRPEGKTK